MFTSVTVVFAFLQASITTPAETVPKTKALMEFLLSMI
jgi:hypothetical protein